MSLRLRITLVVVLVVTAVVAVVGQRVYASAERELVEEVDIELRGRAAGFVNVARSPQFREAFTRSALQDAAAEGFAVSTQASLRELITVVRDAVRCVSRRSTTWAWEPPCTSQGRQSTCTHTDCCVCC